MNKAQKLYIMRNQIGLYKVGISNNVERRRAQIQNTSGLVVEVVETLKIGHRRAYDVEQAMHKELKAVRKEGEWFRCSLHRIHKAHRAVMRKQGNGLLSRAFKFVSYLLAFIVFTSVFNALLH